MGGVTCRLLATTRPLRDARRALTTGGGDPNSKNTADALLRAIAAAPDRPVDSVPTRIAHFRILERLGRGGMGVVYRAEDETLRRTVALKLLPDASGNDETRQRFLREARSAAAITHPNVAVVHQVGEADGRVYIAMELIEGENLRARLDRGRLDVGTARELAGQIARGLSAAHDKGIVHRDLKPENVMITPGGLVKLLDFGLAKPGVDRGPPSGPTEVGLAKTQTVVTSDEGRLMGTPEYMSPEQALGEALDVRSDVFSFGIVLYEMLTGARPFAGASTGALLVAIARDPVPPLRERAPEVDKATQAVVTRCLAKSRAERFASAGEIVAARRGENVGAYGAVANGCRADHAQRDGANAAEEEHRRHWTFRRRRWLRAGVVLDGKTDNDRCGACGGARSALLGRERTPQGQGDHRLPAAED